jgi:hypothetical protein
MSSRFVHRHISIRAKAPARRWNRIAVPEANRPFHLILETNKVSGMCRSVAGKRTIRHEITRPAAEFHPSRS